MTRIIVLPHASLCPQGAVIDAEIGASLCDALLAGGIEIEHACEQSCACTTCHVIVREGFNALGEVSESEEDLLDRAWGLTANSRLSCQAIVTDTPLVVEIPRYTLNLARENTHG
jgi:2Fe-2S ferredoxin